MKTKKSNAGRIAMVFVGMVIGAGFASGAEIRTYFTQYGMAGFLGMAVTILIFILTAWGFLQMAWKRGLKKFEEAAVLLGGEKIGTALDTVVTAFMMISLGVMIAGTGEVFKQQWELPFWMGATLMGILTFAALCRGSRGVLAVNTVLGPFLIFGILLLGITAAGDRKAVAGLLEEPVRYVILSSSFPLVPAMASALIYASYNMIGAAAVFVGLGSQLSSEKEVKRSVITGGLILGVLILAAGLATFLNYDTIETVPIPALEILRNYPFRQSFYVMVLIGAMYTTAVSDGFGVLCRVQQMGRIPRWGWSLIIVAGAFGISCIGFGQLVARGYLVFGCIGLGQLGMLLYYYIKKTGSKKNRET